MAFFSLELDAVRNWWKLVLFWIGLQWIRLIRLFFDTAIWHAVADPPVPEFELFSSEQPGVTVLTDVTSDYFPPENYSIVTRSSEGYWSSQNGGPPETLAGDMVSSSVGVMSWEEFMSIPDTDFGCSRED